MPNLQKRIQQINSLDEGGAKALLKVIYNQIELSSKTNTPIDATVFAKDLRSLLDEYTEISNSKL